jgi:hypothetical protein
MSVFGCTSGPGERLTVRPLPSPPLASPTQDLPLTRAEARALLALAEAGRAALDADRRLLPSRDQREAARRTVGRLRILVQS